MVNLIFNIKKKKCNNLVLKKLGVWSLSRFGTLTRSFSQPVGLYKNKLIKICSIWCILINIKYLKIRKPKSLFALQFYTCIQFGYFVKWAIIKYNLFANGGFDRSCTISSLSYTAWLIIIFAWLLYFFQCIFQVLYKSGWFSLHMHDSTHHQRYIKKVH